MNNLASLKYEETYDRERYLSLDCTIFSLKVSAAYTLLAVPHVMAQNAVLPLRHCIVAMTGMPARSVLVLRISGGRNTGRTFAFRIDTCSRTGKHGHGSWRHREGPFTFDVTQATIDNHSDLVVRGHIECQVGSMRALFEGRGGNADQELLE